MLEAEEAALAGGGKKPGPTANSKKKNNKKKNDLSLLEDALVSSADKKVRKKKEDEAKKQQQLKEEQEQAAAKRQSERISDPLMANTEEMIGGSITEDGNQGRQANKARMEMEGASGLDGALQSLDVSVTEAKSAKAWYKEFEERMLPEMKEEYPGLRLSQYKEKIFQLWKKSPDNPVNQQPTTN